MQDEIDRPANRLRRTWSPTWIAVGVVALVVALALGYSALAVPAATVQVGSPAPDFRLVSLDGQPMPLADYRGQVIVLNFFASWCDPCRAEAADLEQAWQSHRGQGVQFFGIAYKDAQSKAQAFLAQYGITYPTAVEAGNRTARAYGITGVPETFIIDRQGNIAHHFLGAVTREQLSQELDNLLNP